MTSSIIKEVLPYDINTVWSVIRNIEAYPQWRSDVFNVEILDSTRFIEYGKNAFPTTFLITKEEEPFLWEFDIDNANISGRWTGMLQETANGTEAYLKKQQSRFVEDLKHHCKIKGDN